MFDTVTVVSGSLVFIALVVGGMFAAFGWAVRRDMRETQRRRLAEMVADTPENRAAIATMIRAKYGDDAVKSLSQDQIMSLARPAKPGSMGQGLGQSGAVAVASRDETRWGPNWHMPRSQEEARAVVDSMVMREQLQRMVEDPATSPLVDVSRTDVEPPKIADGRPVDYARDRRQPLRLTPGYTEALRRNAETMVAFLADREGVARPAITWVKPDHMMLTHDTMREEGDRSLSDLALQKQSLLEMRADMVPGSPSVAKVDAMIAEIDAQTPDPDDQRELDIPAPPANDAKSAQAAWNAGMWEGNCYFHRMATCQRQVECRARGECMDFLAARYPK